MKNLKSVFYDDASTMALLEAKDRREMLKAIQDRSQAEIGLVLKGDKGEKGDSPSEQELLALIEPLIPEKGEDGYSPIKGIDYFDGSHGKDGIAGKNGRDGKNGKDGRDGKELDISGLFDTFVERLQKEKLLDVSHLRNAESFLFNGRRYKTEELMHGSGTSSTSSSLHTETPTGTVDDSNTTFTVIKEPFYIVINGAEYFVGTGSYTSYVAGTITLSSPVGLGGFIRSVYQA